MGEAGTLTQRKRARKANSARRAAVAYVAKRTALRAGEDGPTDERKMHGSFVQTSAISGSDGRPAQAGTKMYRSQIPIERYRSRGEISERQATAGLRLRNDWEIGICGARQRDILGSKAVHGPVGYSDMQLDAAMKYRDAVRVLGPAARAIVEPVVCGDEAGGDVTVGMLAKSRADMTAQQLFGAFKIGLDTLANHYGLP